MSAGVSRSRKFARIMSQPPVPDPTPSLRPGSETLVTLITLGQELAGTCDPVTVAERVSSALVRLLRPTSLLMVFTDDTAQVRRVACSHNIANPVPDDPLIELAVRAGLRAVP